MLKHRGVFLNKIIILTFLLSFSAFSSESMVKDSMKKYLDVFDKHKVENIDLVLEKKFLDSLGGKKRLSEGVQQLEKTDSKYKFEIVKTHKKNSYKVRYFKDGHKHPSKWFLLRKIKNNYKIFGTFEE